MSTRTEQAAKERIGMTNVTKSGMKITIIEYRNSRDIDIQFEDGSIIKHKTYSAFCRGEFACPTRKYRIAKTKNIRIGETKIANNGMKVTIIAYRNSHDIDVQFEDGIVAKHKTYQSFSDGSISCYQSLKDRLAKDRIGMTKIANNGMQMTIIQYRNAEDITVQFKDGTIVDHKSYNCFLIGSISNPTINFNKAEKRSAINHNSLKKSNPLIKKRIGMTHIANNGMEMTIIEYRNCNDIDVQFEDGEITKHKTYQSFLKGGIAHPTIKISKSQILHAKDRIGKTTTANNGMKMTIIEYRNYNDIDVQFENGTIIKHICYQNFLNGSITLFKNKIDIHANDRIGKTTTANNGIKMTIIEYRNCSDIDVQFEDGTVVKHKTYNNFIKGEIANPVANNVYHKRLKNRTGETSIANNGMQMTIIAYRKAEDIDIQFEDGTVVKHKTYNNFIKGDVSSRIINDDPKNRIGDISLAKNGLKIMIIAYRSANDIDVQFEDGTIVKQIRYGNFQTGRVGHPAFLKYGKHLYHGYTIKKISTLPGNIVLYSCKDQNDNTSIMTLQELLDKAGVKRLDFSENLKGVEDPETITENTAS